MPSENRRMTPDEFRAALLVLGETQSSFADLLVMLGDTGGDKARLVQRWATGQQDIPRLVNALLQLLILVKDVEGITPDIVRAWLAAADEQEEPATG